MIEIPVIPSAPFYKMRVPIEDIQKTFVFELRWNGRESGWFADLLDEDEDPLIRGVKMVLGIPLFPVSYDIRWPGGAFFAVDTAGAHEEAGLDDLGTRVKIYYLTPDEVTEIADG